MHARARVSGNSRGFTYLGLIILVAVIGLVGAASLKVGSLLQRAAAEEELLDIGAAFSDALRSYAAATPPGQPQQPPTLQELLKDPRFPNPRRHLRKIFVDPITGKAEWGIMYLGDKVGVLGVYSLSNARPLKVANFDPRFLNMENKEHLSDWKFTLSSQTLVPAQQAPGAPQAAVPGAPPPDGSQPSLFGTPPMQTPITAAAAPPEAPPEPAAATEAASAQPAELMTDEQKTDDQKAAEEKEREAEKEREDAEKAENAEKEAAQKREDRKEPRPDDNRPVEKK